MDSLIKTHHRSFGLIIASAALWVLRSRCCPGLGHARLAEACPLDPRWRCSSTSLRLLPRVVLRVDVGESPWAFGADLYNRLFFHEDIVRHAWRKGVETARGQGLRLARIGASRRPIPTLQGPQRNRGGQLQPQQPLARNETRLTGQKVPARTFEVAEAQAYPRLLGCPSSLLRSCSCCTLRRSCVYGRTTAPSVRNSLARGSSREVERRELTNRA